MRFAILATGLLFTTVAFAQTAPITSTPLAAPPGSPTTSAPAATPAAAAPAVTAPAKPAVAKPAAAKPPAKPKAPVLTDDQRFEAANASHDGKLTKDQATKGKWRTVSRNFTAIDKDKKGYVTLEDIKAYNASKKPTPKPAAKPAVTTPAKP